MKTNKSKFFFLFLFISLILIPISSFSINVSAAEGDPVVISDFLKVELIEFNDDTPGDTKRNLNYMPGGRDLHSFENKGILQGSYDNETNSFVVWAEATFGFEVNAWTACLISDIYPEIQTEVIREVEYFKYQLKKHIQLPFTGCEDIFGNTNPDDTIYGTKTYKYNFRYREVDYGSIDNLHNHDGSIETKIWIDPGRKLSGEMTVAGRTFTVPTLEADILDLTIADMRGGVCGSYEDRYTTAEDDEGGVEFSILEGEYYPGETTKIIDWLIEKDIGWGNGSDLPEDPTLGEHDGVCDLTFKGYDFPGSNTNEMTFDLPIHIQPQVTVHRQYIPYTYGYFLYYPCCAKFSGSPIVNDESISRDLSVHVYNIFAHYDLKVKLDLFMDCQFTGELSESFLEDPNLIITDRVWDATVWGQEADVLFEPTDMPWWMWIIIILIVVVGVYIGYKLLSKYISRKKPAQIIVRR